MLIVVALGCILFGAGVSARSLKQSKQCFDDSNLMGMDLFAEKALACSPVQGEQGVSEDTCCEKVRSLFGENAVLDKCLCDAQYFTSVTSQLPVDQGVTAESFISDMASCGIAVKGDHRCGGGHGEPLVMAHISRKFLLGGHLIKKAFGTGYGVGSALGGGGGGGYGYGPIIINGGDDDDDDDGGARPVPVPPFTPVPPPPPPPPPPTPPPPPAGTPPPPASPPPPPAGGANFFGNDNDGGDSGPDDEPAPADGGGDNGDNGDGGDEEPFGFFG
ncbi:hypothetical protein BSKO_01082 [Bryopsis sp. KO-2023]|nr:hypothetical protein BSKO_01082 [Bryopsis sp. KO-2023]